MAERSLPTRRRKKADPGKPIRVSKLVFAELDKSRRKLSWDCFFRSMLGLPTRAGKQQPLVEGMLCQLTGMLILKTPETNWPELAEFTTKISNGKFRPIRMREVR